MHGFERCKAACCCSLASLVVAWRQAGMAQHGSAAVGHQWSRAAQHVMSKGNQHKLDAETAAALHPPQATAAASLQLQKHEGHTVDVHGLERHCSCVLGTAQVAPLAPGTSLGCTLPGPGLTSLIMWRAVL